MTTIAAIATHSAAQIHYRRSRTPDLSRMSGQNKTAAAPGEDAAAAWFSEARDHEDAGVTAVAAILPLASLLNSTFTFSPTCSEAASMLAGNV